MQIYVDLDGTLCDFDTHHEVVFGYRSDKRLDNVDWAKVRAVEGFYRDIPPMPDMAVLWEYLRPYRPIVLTGVPKSVEEAAANKREWCARYLGEETLVICCRSSEKTLYCKPGDILVDDWDKHKDLWIKAGGLWITHYSALGTIERLGELGVGDGRVL